MKEVTIRLSIDDALELSSILKGSRFAPAVTSAIADFAAENEDEWLAAVKRLPENQSFQVGETLLMESVAGGEIEVNYRGKTQDGLAIIWTGTMQFPVSVHRLRRK